MKKTASSWLTIDLGALAANYNIFKGIAAPGCAVAGVIKADGYGLGVDKVLAALENQGCPFYFVATLDEALHVRRLTPKPVGVFGGLYHGAEDLYVNENITPVLNSLAEIDRWQQQARHREGALPALIHFDTGMSRLGLGPDEILELHQSPDLIDGLHILFLMSHFACADDKDHGMTEAQHERFKQAAAPFPSLKKSLANSSGAFRSDAYHFDMIRPGIALYGGNPVPETANPMNPVVALQTRILQVRAVAPGATAGYGATCTFSKKTRTATVALGYADGFLRSLSNRGSLYYNGQPCPIAGRVSMDTVIVDIGHLNAVPRAGETMEVLGPHQPVDTLADAARTIGYEILTGLGGRYHRDYIG